MNINNRNTIIITTTLPNCETSEKRRTNLFNNFNKYKIPILFNQGKIEKKPYKSIPIERLISFLKTNYEYGIICDDDFYPIDNFLDELNKTVDKLPSNWKCLHLCPGYLWGRFSGEGRDYSLTEEQIIIKNKFIIGKLNPEHNMDNIEYDDSGRFYKNCNPNIYCSKKFWLGGPEAFLIKKDYVLTFLKKFIKTSNNIKEASDVIFTNILDEFTYICREPQMGYENECGNTLFPRTTNGL